MRHVLRAVRKTLHGVFHRTIPPVLWVSSGDIVTFETLEVGWRTQRVIADREVPRIEPRDPVFDNGPALTGPVAVRGARPGMVLEVQMLSFQTGSWGWTSAGGESTCIAGLGVEEAKASLFWDLRRRDGEAINQRGQSVPLEPFLGTIGLSSADPDIVPGWVPHPRTAGNIDCALLTPGSSLFLPIEVDGGLLSVGDAHAAQADGEIAGTAIECPMEAAQLRLILHTDSSWRSFRARTAQGLWATFGLAASLDEAAVMASNRMLDLLQERRTWSRSEALAWASTSVDLRITQMVNPLRGVHALLRQEP